MEDKFIATGYKASELLTSKEKALQLDREQILANHQITHATNNDENI
jgi:hypothetical protein